MLCVNTAVTAAAFAAIAPDNELVTTIELDYEFPFPKVNQAACAILSSIIAYS